MDLTPNQEFPSPLPEERLELVRWSGLITNADVPGQAMCCGVFRARFPGFPLKGSTEYELSSKLMSTILSFGTIYHITTQGKHGK